MRSVVFVSLAQLRELHGPRNGFKDPLHIFVGTVQILISLHVNSFPSPLQIVGWPIQLERTCLSLKTGYSAWMLPLLEKIVNPVSDFPRRSTITCLPGIRYPKVRLGVLLSPSNSKPVITVVILSRRIDTARPMVESSNGAV